MLPVDTISEIEHSAWFRASRSPYLLADTDLRIRAVNKAHVLATGQPPDLIIGAPLFEVYPDNPADPDADGVAVICHSMELVFRRGARHSVGVQRYDVPDRARPGEFIHKIWTPVNSPIKVGGKTVAVLNHVQDVTALLASHPDARLPELVAATREMRPEFPALTDAELLGVLTHSLSVVVASTGTADLQHAMTLARLRVEVRCRRPAGPGTTV